jgi:hypothetical protein
VITTRAAALRLPGIHKIREWTTIDKRSDKAICGVVMDWSLDNAIRASNDREEQTALKGSEGGKGILAKPVAAKTTATENTKREDDGNKAFDPTKKVEGNKSTGAEGQDF